jgi:hypothetical protein
MVVGMTVFLNYTGLSIIVYLALVRRWSVRACGRDDQGLEARLLLQNYSNANLKFKYMWTVAKSNNDKDFIGTDITKVSVTCTITNGSRPSSMVYV